MVSEVKSLSRVRLFVTPWTVAYRVPPSMGFSRQEYCSADKSRLYVMFVCVCACARAQSCLTLCKPMGSSLSSSSVNGIFQARITGVGCHFLLQGIFLTQELNWLSCSSYIGRWILYHLCHVRSPLYIIATGNPWFENKEISFAEHNSHYTI